MHLGDSTRRHWLVGICSAVLFALGSGMLVPPRLAAQAGPSTAVLRSPLHSIFEGHTLQLTVAELGSPSVPSTVIIEFRDASNQTRAITSTSIPPSPRTMTPTVPVRLRLPLAAGSGLSQLRAIVTISAFSGGSTPAVSFEDLDVNSFTARSFPPCTLAMGDTSSGSGWEAMCTGGGWSTTTNFLP